MKQRIVAARTSQGTPLELFAVRAAMHGTVDTHTQTVTLTEPARASHYIVATEYTDNETGETLCIDYIAFPS